MIKYIADVTTETTEIAGKQVKFATFKQVTDVQTNELVLKEYQMSEFDLPLVKLLEDGDSILMDADISTLYMFMPTKDSVSKNQISVIENVGSIVVTRRKNRK